MTSIKMCKANIYLDRSVWRAFRITCLEKGMTASGMIGRLLRAQLQKWAKEDLEIARLHIEGNRYDTKG